VSAMVRKITFDGAHAGSLLEFTAANNLSDVEALAIYRHRWLCDENENKTLASFIANIKKLSELHISSCSIDGNTLQALSTGFIIATSLQKLSLSDTFLSQQTAAVMATQAFPRLVNLKDLVISNCGVDAIAMEALAPGIAKLMLLEKLDLSTNSFGAGGVQALRVYFFPHAAHLKELRLHSVFGIDDRASAEFVQCCGNLSFLTLLDLSRCGLNTVSMQILAPGFQQLASLRSLLLAHNCNLGVAGVGILGQEVMPHLQKLQVLNMTCCGIVENAAKPLGSGLAHVGTLETLTLANNALGTMGARDLGSVAFASLHQLKDLDMSNCGLDIEAMKALAPTMSRLSRLEVLSFQGNDLGTEGARALSEVLPSFPHLKILNLRHCDFARPAVEALAQGVAQLKNFEAFDIADRRLMSKFVRSMSYKHMPQPIQLAKLRVLHVESCNIDASYMKQFVTGLRLLSGVEKLVLKGNDMGVEGAQALAVEGLPYLSLLRDLNIADCGLGELAFQEIAPGLKCLSKLEKLNLRGNELGSAGAAVLAREVLPALGLINELILANNELEPEDIQVIAASLNHVPLLEKLVLMGNTFDSMAGNSLAAVAFPHLLHILELNLCNCTLDASGLTSMAAGLGSLCTLVKLVLSSNSIGLEGAQAFAIEACPNLSNLQVLDMCHCGLEPQAIQVLASGLQWLNSLERLILQGNSIGADGAGGLATYAFPSLNSLGELNISYADLDSSAMQKLAPGLAKLRCLKCLNMRNNKFGHQGALQFGVEALPFLEQLQTLEIRLCDLEHDAVEALTPSLGRLRHLQQLEFGDKRLLLAFLLMLPKCCLEPTPYLTQLKELTLDKCNLASSDMRDLVAGLQYLLDLEVLNLRGNDFGEEGARVLAGALPSFLNLRELHLSFCCLSSDAVAALVPGLQHLSSLEVLNLMGNSMDISAATVLVKKVLPHLLRLKECNLIEAGVTAEELKQLSSANGIHVIVSE